MSPSASPESAPVSRVKALLFTDMAGSSKMKATLTPDASARVFRECAELFKEALSQSPGGVLLENPGDSLYAAFDAPSEAVKTALRFQFLLSRAPEHPWRPEVRAGIHFGEVLLQEDAATGRLKPFGSAVDLAARVMGLADGCQTLMTREVFRAARPWLDGHPPVSGATAESLPQLAYRSYQQYVFKGIIDPLTGLEREPIEICEIGAQGLARLEAPADSAKAERFRRPGDDAVTGWRPGQNITVPGRDDWTLDKFIGEGGFGEVWLARKSRGNELRVFKFCFEAARVKSFLREEKLFHLLQDELKDRGDIVPVRDVRLAEGPYFIAYDYYPAGSLLDWARELGGGAVVSAGDGPENARDDVRNELLSAAQRRGMEKIPLEVRLSLFVQTARAVGAAHSLGIIHKDIKPANIFISHAGTGHPQALLGDFGLGVLEDLAKLEKIGHSQTGFSGELVAKNESSRTGSRMYAAPEYLQGRPASIQGDVFALGVLLYQLYTGDLERPLAHGWEKQVEDPLFREDIATAVEGDTGLRFRSVEELADRIVNLDARRKAAAEKLAETRRAARRKRMVRLSVAACVVLAAVSGALAWGLVREAKARAVAEGARDSAEELINHMLVDLKQRLEPIGRIDLLAKVSDSAIHYFEKMRSLEGNSGASRELQRALALGAAANLDLLRGNAGKARVSLTECVSILHRLVANGDDVNRSDVLNALSAASCLQARALGKLGQAEKREQVLRDALAQFDNHNAAEPVKGHAALIEELGDHSWDGKNYVAAEAHYRRFLELQTVAAAASPRDVSMQRPRVWAMSKVARSLAMQKKVQEADVMWKAAADLVAELSRTDPQDRNLHHDLAVVTGDRAEAAAAAEDFNAARTGSWDYLVKLEALTRHDPTNAKWQWDFSNACVELAKVIKDWKPPSNQTSEISGLETEKPISVSVAGVDEPGLLRHAISIRERLTRLDAQNIDWHASLYKARHRLIQALSANRESGGDSGRTAEILDNARKIFETCSLLVSLQPANSSYKLARVEFGLMAAGFLAMTGKSAEALPILDIAIASAETLTGDDRSDVEKNLARAVKLRDRIRKEAQ